MGITVTLDEESAADLSEYLGKFVKAGRWEVDTVTFKRGDLLGIPIVKAITFIGLTQGGEITLSGDMLFMFGLEKPEERPRRARPWLDSDIGFGVL